MKKILIAGIGGGKVDKSNTELKRYKPANYKIGDKVYENKPFITSALEEHYNIDKTIYIGTTGSMWDNLYSYYCKKFNIPEDEDYTFKLLEIIDAANNQIDFPIDKLDLTKFNETFKGKVEGRLTTYGMNASEIFKNFNIIMNLNNILNDGDEVYIDITHSFRSNAMWMFLVINFIDDIIDKKITIKEISYGMLEVARANNNITPVVDLSSFYKLLKWIKGANAFKKYGNSYDLLDIISDDDIRKKLNNFSESMNLNYIKSIKNNIKSLKNINDKIDAIKGPGKFLIPDIVHNFINEFDGIEEDYLVQARLAKWHFKQKRYAMAYININESIKGYVENELKDYTYIPKNDNSNPYYAKAKAFLYRITYKEHTIKNYYPEILELYKMFDHSTKVRNEIAHSKGEIDSSLSDIISLKNYCDKIETILSNTGNIATAERYLNLLNN